MEEKRSLELYNRLSEAECRVAPTLVFSKAARTAPLKSPWLSELRDFLCRTGGWKDHPIDSVELFAASPAPGVDSPKDRPNVIGPAEPVFTSVGFGSEGVRNGRVEYKSGICSELRLPSLCDALICAVNISDRNTAPPCNLLDPTGGRAALGGPVGPVCLVLDPPEPGLLPGTGGHVTPQCLALGPDGGTVDPMRACLALDPMSRTSTCYDSYCGGETCLEENCSSHKCGTNGCDGQFCGDHLCGTKTSCPSKAAHAGGFWENELLANGDHPFVKELMDYFGAGDYRKLETDIIGFVGRNMFARFSNE